MPCFPSSCSTRHSSLALPFSSLVLVFLALAALPAGPLGAQGRPEAAREKQRSLIATLRTGTAPQKALACKELAVYGDKEAVPALAPLLLDGQLSSWARIALEAIDDPAAARPCARRWARPRAASWSG